MPRPNILLIMCDQLRADCLGSAAGGDGHVATPAIDRIAGEATRFDACYTNAPVCVPARISLATGLYPHQFGLQDNLARRCGEPVAKGEGHALDPAWPTWMAAIRDSGYRTALVGKTHLHFHDGDLRDREYLLQAYGFDEFDEIGGPRASARVGSHLTEAWQEAGLWQAYQEDYRQRFAQALPLARPGALPLAHHADVYVGSRSAAWLDAYRGSQPWLLWASFGGPHEPWDTPEPYASRYDPAAMPIPLPRPAWADALPADCQTARRLRQAEAAYAVEGGMTTGLARRLRADYAGNVSLIDDQIAGILAAIERRGELDQTVIAFVSDHGECNGDYGLVGKGLHLDPTVRVPCLLRTPATSRRGPAVASGPVELMDIGPTLVDYAGASWQMPHHARSLTAAVEDPTTACRSLALSEHLGEAMVSDGRYKAIFSQRGGLHLLFDRQEDPDETVNRANDPRLAAVRDRLREGLLRRLLASQLQEPPPRCRWWQIRGDVSPATGPGPAPVSG